MMAIGSIVRVINTLNCTTPRAHPQLCFAYVRGGAACSTVQPVQTTVRYGTNYRNLHRPAAHARSQEYHRTEACAETRRHVSHRWHGARDVREHALQCRARLLRGWRIEQDCAHFHRRLSIGKHAHARVLAWCAQPRRVSDRGQPGDTPTRDRGSRVAAPRRAAPRRVVCTDPPPARTKAAR